MNFRIFLCSLIIGFSIFQQGIYAAAGDPIDPFDCEIEQLLDPTVICQVTPPSSCPIWQTGTYPNCVITPSCSFWQTGTYPNCVTPPSCPPWQVGIYPNCVTPPPSCPLWQTGTYPNCISPTSGTLAVTWFYGQPLDILNRWSDNSYSLNFDVFNRFFRAEWVAKYISPQRVVRITTNRNQYYVQSPINSNGTWSVFDTTTPGYVLSAFLQKWVNNLKVSYYDKATKSFINTWFQKISITLY